MSVSIRTCTDGLYAVYYSCPSCRQTGNRKLSVDGMDTLLSGGGFKIKCSACSSDSMLKTVGDGIDLVKWDFMPDDETTRLVVKEVSTARKRPRVEASLTYSTSRIESTRMTGTMRNLVAQTKARYHGDSK